MTPLVPPPPDGLRLTHLHVGGDSLVVLSSVQQLEEAACRIECLTVAERQVLALLLEGRSNQDIAEERVTSERTVANQVAAIFRKLGVSSRRELAALLTHDSDTP